VAGGAFDLGTITLAGVVSTVVRSLVVYIAVLAALRLAGKRHVGQLSIVDFVLVLLVSNAVQNAMVGADTSLIGGLVAAVTLILVNLLLTHFVLRHEKLGSLVEGEPTLLVRNGKVIDSHLASEGIRRAELDAAIREHGLEDEKHCRLVIQEIDGSISVVPYGDDAKEHHLPPIHRQHRRAGRRGKKPGQ
jgi:uncharacterized membrane protein YcaP (DUF421 family)